MCVADAFPHPPRGRAPSAALAFQGIGFFDVGLLVFTGQLHRLAGHVVPCGPRQAARSREQWVQLLRHRLQAAKAGAGGGDVAGGDGRGADVVEGAPS